jgi:predicted SAM-dependent methyltransferase
MRERAISLHHSKEISWIDDHLPDVDSVVALEKSFDFLLLSAVWMHLDKAERTRAMMIVKELTKPGGQIVITLRHGTVPLVESCMTFQSQRRRSSQLRMPWCATT